MNRKIKGLYAIVDDAYLSAGPLVEQAKIMLDNGVKLLQLRLKNSSQDSIQTLAKQFGDLKKQYSFTYILNDFPQIAKDSGADGVHLGQDDLSVGDARKIMGPYAIIGKSNHTLAEAKKSLLEHTDYIALGAIFPTMAKGPDHPVVGCDLLQEVVAITAKPVVAIGGINESNLASIKSTKVQSFAVVSGLVQGGNIAQNVKKLIALWENLP